MFLIKGTACAEAEDSEYFSMTRAQGGKDYMRILKWVDARSGRVCYIKQRRSHFTLNQGEPLQDFKQHIDMIRIKL